jgi:hypothetical protein
MASLRSRLLSWPGIAAIAVLVVLAALAGPKLVDALSGGAGSADERFATVCRAHGGTPSLAPGSGDYVKDARSCEIEYAGDRYEMYAVHPEGFSEREAAQGRRACTLLARQKRSDAEKTGADVGSLRVVWHPRSGICESQP